MRSEKCEREMVRGETRHPPRFSMEIGRLAAALPSSLLLLLLLIIITGGAVVVESATDSSDVQALGVLYTYLNSPPQLAGWKPSGGDPCGDSWKGITCSGSAVTAIQLSGLGLNGSLGFLLSDLLSLTTLDLSDNNIQETIPYQLPPNVIYLNLAGNNLSGNLPYSISNMAQLNYLNLSHNQLSQSIGDIFRNLQSLSDLDLSFDNFTGDLPSSFGYLSNLSSLFLQSNQLTGPIDVLANLSLSNLNIAANHFTGWIPPEFSSIQNLELGGNSFSNSLAPPPPLYTPPPPSRPHRVHNSSQASWHAPQRSLPQDHASDHKRLSTGLLIGIATGSILGLLCIILALVLCLRKVHKSEDISANNANDHGRPAAVATNTVIAKEMQEKKLKSSITTPKPIADTVTVEKMHGKSGASKRPKVPITATPYTVASLQMATNSFSQDFLVGEGSFGRVYRAELPNGKVLAVKKIDSVAISLQEEDNFLEAISTMSRLRHPNIVILSGYCIEYGQRLLVYEYIGNGTLHDKLHFTDFSSKILSWNARIRVALGTAKALEYLHEVCLPAVVHRNFKSSNILLDEELNPHLSDCCLAALRPNTERQVSTEVAGSFGYSAPEFAMLGVYTIKSDVYSFGVVMLELLTGRKPLDSSRARSEQSLVRWASPQLHDIDALSKMVDPALNGMYPAKSLSRFADIIALCVQPEPEFRPPMSEVVQQLVRLVQRASVVRRHSDELGFSYRVPDQNTSMSEISKF
ncbi:protein STRUBBELIG-RECEPTOR FAMILY 8-like [Zingiber officinale]|uniref:protein STRUBBELIG-RECEPTOR FAMILY 8-like n=1 Tax=Zingiber officinale TaxID=94328 RepID=UPI001C4AD188|nr:protein STRUBBELIG-RECEPTOR FAMILY 8-like [Zingiber officinale]